MYISRNWEFDLALEKFQNFGGGVPPKHPTLRYATAHCWPHTCVDEEWQEVTGVSKITLSLSWFPRLQYETCLHVVVVQCHHMSLMDVVVSLLVVAEGNRLWGWDAHEAWLRCPNEVDGDIWIWSTRRGLDPLPALTYQNVLHLNVACRAKRTQTYWHVRKFKCPLKKTQPSYPCSTNLNWIGRRLNLNSNNYPDHGHHGDPPLSGKNPHGRARNRPRDLMISSQKCWPRGWSALLYLITISCHFLLASFHINPLRSLTY
jgi:hypothetical protein